MIALMQLAVRTSLVIFLLVLTCSVVILTIDAHHAIEYTAEEISFASTHALAEIDQTRQDANAQLADMQYNVLALANAQLNGLRADAKQEAESAIEMANDQLTQANGSMAQVASSLVTLQHESEPLLSHAVSIASNTDQATAILFRRDALPAQLLGVTAAAKIALGETAKTMRTVDAAAPQIVANVKQATDASAKTAQDTDKLMANLAEETKPLPKWLRVVFAVAPPIAETAAGAATAWLALH